MKFSAGLRHQAVKLGYAENRGTYYRGRYKIAPGKYGTVCDASGATIRFRTKREAEQAANDEEAKMRGGTWRDPSTGRELFGIYVSKWYARLDLAASTMETYRGDIEGHLLPEFEEKALDEISDPDIAAWEKKEKVAGYAPKSIKNWRALLHLILEDAYDEDLIKRNPATTRRGRGKRAGRSSHRAPEKIITDPLGALRIAERAALLAGRDDEFVACVLKAYTGMRWGEVVGLEKEFVRPGSIRIEWQLYQLDTGELHRCPPKDDSYRTVDLPGFLSDQMFDHIRRTAPRPCQCHGRTYVFRGLDASNGAARRPGATLADVARRAGVSPATVSTFLNRPGSVAPQTRSRIESAITDLGYVPAGRRATQLRIGAETALPHGCSNRQRRAGIQGKDATRHGQCQYVPNRGRVCLSAAGTPLDDQTCAGSRSPQGSRHMACVTHTRRACGSCARHQS